MFQSNKLNNNISSILGPELKINGDINVNGDLLIYGEVSGNVTCKGTLHSAKGSIVKGNINSKNIFVNGAIEGDIEAKSKATLGKGSHLEGNLQASIITIEEGARFDGMCHMIKDETKVKKIQTIDEAKYSSQNETA